MTILVGPIKTASGDYGTCTDGTDEFGRVISVAPVQSADLEVVFDHDWRLPIGRIRALERQRNGVVLAAADVPAGGPADGVDLNTGFSFSMAGGGRRDYKIADPLVSHVDHEGWFLTHVGLVRGRPHMIGLQPVVAIEGDWNTRSAGGWPRRMPWEWKCFLDRAMDARRPSFVRARQVELMVADAPGCVPPVPALDAIELQAEAAARGELVTDERGRTHHRRVNIGHITSIT